MSEGAVGGGEAVSTDAGESAQPEATEAAVEVMTGEAEEAETGSEEGKQAEAGEGAPESYTSFDMPEGWQVAETFVEPMNAFFQLGNFSQEEAQTGMNLVMGHLQEVLGQVEQSKTQAWADTRKAGSEAIVKEWGDKLPAAKAAVRTLVKQFGNAPGSEKGGELDAVLRGTGVGDDPHMFRVLAKAGALLMEDTSHGGGKEGVTEDNTSIAERLYGKDGMSGGLQRDDRR